MRRLTLVLTLLLVLAGCTGPGSDVAGTETPTVTPASTPTVTLDTPTDATAGNTVDYVDLSPEGQAAFDAAVDGEVKFLLESPYVEGEYFEPSVAEEFGDVEYVRTDERTYALSRSFGELYASYDLYAEPASPADDATVIDHENLSSNVSTEVRWAVENGSHYLPLGKWDSLPPDLDDTDYVRYDGKTYRMSYAVGDYWVLVLEARPA